MSAQERDQRKFELQNVELGQTAQQVRPSVIRQFEPQVDNLREKGIAVFPWNLGAPGHNPFEPIMRAQREIATDPRFAKYGESTGEVRLRRVIRDRLNAAHHNGITADDIVVGHGSSELIDFVFKSVLDPGDGVVLFEPYYSNYATLATENKGKVISIPTSIDEGFHFPSYEVIQRSIQEALKKDPEIKRIRAVVANSPSNPSGVVYGESDWEKIFQLTGEHNALLISDEAYIEFDFTNGRSTSVLDITKKGSGGFVALRTFSKDTAVPGWRIGYAVTFDPNISPGLKNFAMARGSANNPAMHALIEIDRMGDEYFVDMRNYYREIRDELYSRLGQVPGIKLPPRQPEGAFYLIVELPVDSAENFARYLLTDFVAEATGRKETLLVVPLMAEGSQGFYGDDKPAGSSERRQIRIPFVNKDVMDKGINIIESALSVYPGRLPDQRQVFDSDVVLSASII